jgi:hypothetical protein
MTAGRGQRAVGAGTAVVCNWDFLLAGSDFFAIGNGTVGL